MKFKEDVMFLWCDLWPFDFQNLWNENITLVKIFHFIMTYVYIIYEKNLPHIFIMTLKWENVFKACKTCKVSGYVISFPLQKK